MSEYSQSSSESKRKREWRVPIFAEIRYPELPPRSTMDWSLWLRAFTLDTRIEPNHFKVGVTLAEHYNLNDGRCFPSHDMLALLSGVHRSTVRRALRELERLGWVRVTRTRKFGTGRQGANEYELTLPDEIREIRHSAEFAESDVTVITRDPDAQTGELGVQIASPGVHGCEPIIGKLSTGNIEHSVLRTASLRSDASFQEIYRGIFGQRESKEALQQRASCQPIAKPYTASDVECLYDTLANVDRMTFDGIIACSRNPSSWGGNGIEPAPLRAMLNDCAGARLIWAERNGRKVYYGLTRQGEECEAIGWMDALGVHEQAA